MMIYVFLALFIGAVTAGSRIHGGTPTSVEKYPAAVQIEAMFVWPRGWGQSCGGTVLNPLYILSAANCFDGTFYHRHNRRIRAGSSYRDIGGVIVYIVREFNHPNYNFRTFESDITVLLLNSALTLSPVIQQTTIPPQGAIIPDNIPVTLLGWGHVEDDTPSPVLLEVSLPTINRPLCDEHYFSLTRRNVTDTMICAGRLDTDGFGPCSRDAGGPVYYGNLQIGIISWGISCALAMFPSVSVNVASFTDWIIERAG